MAKFSQVSYTKLIKRHWSFITVTTLIVLLISLLVTLVQPFEYSSQIKILVIQKSAVGIDAYSASKSAERIGRNLAQVINSTSFYNKVINSGYGIDSSYFPEDEAKKRKLWEKTVTAEVPSGTTVLEVTAYHPDPDQATRIVQAISYVLDTSVDEYVGLSDVDLQEFDQPLTSKYPVKPNFIVNAVMGLLLGLFLAISLLIITFSEEKEAAYMMHEEQKRLAKVEKQERKKAAKYGKYRVTELIQAEPEDIEQNIPDVEQALRQEDGEDEFIEQEAHQAAQKEQHEEENHEPAPEYEQMKSFGDEDEIKTFYDYK